MTRNDRSFPLMNTIYLDNNATTRILPAVVEAMDECYRQGYANPASQHAEGRRARRVLEEARTGIAKILGADVGGSHPDRLIFTSGGTESNNLAIRGLIRDTSRPVMASRIEHASVLAPLDAFSCAGWVPATAAGSSERERHNFGPFPVARFAGSISCLDVGEPRNRCAPIRRAFCHVLPARGHTAAL